MANIFQPQVGDIPASQRIVDTGVNTATGQAIALAGNTIWEGYKGKVVSDFADSGQPLTTELQPQSLNGEVGSTELITSKMGLKQLQDAVDQGKMSQRQADALARAKAAELINKIPGLTKDIQRELDMFGSGGLGLTGSRSGGGGGKPQTVEEAQMQGFLKGTEEAVKNGFPDYQTYAHIKHESTMYSLEAQKAAALNRSVADETAALAAASQINMATKATEITQRIADRTITQQDGYAQLAQIVGQEIAAYRQKISAIAADPERRKSAGELMANGDLDIARLRTFGDDMLAQSPQALQQILNDSYQTAMNLDMGAAPAIMQQVALAKHIGPEYASVITQSAMNQNKQAMDIVNTLFQLDGKRAVPDAVDHFAKQLGVVVKGKGKAVKPPPLGGPAGAGAATVATDVINKGVDAVTNDYMVSQLLSEMEVDRTGLITDSIAQMQDNFLEAKDIQNMDQFTKSISSNLTKSLMESFANLNGLSGETKAMLARHGHLYDPDKDLINYLLIVKKNPKAFDQEQIINDLMIGAEAFGYPTDILKRHIERAGISMPETSSEATGDENVPKPTPSPTSATTEPEMSFDFLKEQEGFSDKPYSDHKQTSIGYGTKARPGQTSITEEEASKDLEAHVQSQVIPKVKGKAWYEKLGDRQKEVVISLIYNIGWGAFAKSKAFAALKEGDNETFLLEAFDAERGFVRASGEVNEGLQARRKREQDRFVGTG